MELDLSDNLLFVFFGSAIVLQLKPDLTRLTVCDAFFNESNDKGIYGTRYD